MFRFHICFRTFDSFPPLIPHSSSFFLSLFHNQLNHSNNITSFKMLDNLAFPISFKWTSMKDNSSYHAIRVEYDEHANFTMTQQNGEVLELLTEQPKWFEFVILIHSSDFVVPKSHGIRGLINFINLNGNSKLRFKLSNEVV